MSTTFRRLARTLALGLSVFAASLAVAPETRADAIDDQITAMKNFEKAGEEGKCIAKMQELKDSGDPKVLAAIKDLKSSKKDKIAVQAMRMIANRKDPELLKWLITKLDDKDLRDEKDGRPEVYKGVLASVAAYRSKTALKALEDVVKKFISTNADYATLAIAAYGTVPEKPVVEQLLKWLEATDSRAGGQGGGGGGKGKSTETYEIEGKAKTQILATLFDLTGQEIADAVTWRAYWTTNSKTFTFPDPDAPAPAEAAQGDPSSLSEYKDEAYGFSIKKPDGDSWKFSKADYPGPRVALSYTKPDDPAYLMGKVYFTIHNPAKSSPKDIKAFVDWVINDTFKKQLVMDEAKPPTVEEKKIGKTDWTVVRGLGDGDGVKKSWGSVERRYYLAKVDKNIIYIDAIIRLGAEPAEKEMLWKCIEGTVITGTAPAPKK